jgi:hypothetical protein
MEKELVPTIERKLVERGKELLVLEDGSFLAMNNDNLLEINAVRIYEPIYKGISGPNSFAEEEKKLRWAFSHKMFNLLDYINPKSKTIMSYIHSLEHLESLFSRIREDLGKGYVPFKLGVYCALNTKKLRKFAHI